MMNDIVSGTMRAMELITALVAIALYWVRRWHEG